MLYHQALFLLTEMPQFELKVSNYAVFWIRDAYFGGGREGGSEGGREGGRKVSDFRNEETASRE